MSRRKPAPDLIRGGHRFADKDMRKWQMNVETAMQHRITKTVAATSAVLILLVAVAAAAVPQVRHLASGWWNNPETLAGLPENRQVRYEDGAIDRARIVAALLPAAIARVEAVQGRPFAHPVTIGVYLTPEAFAAANGTGSAGAVGMHFLGRVILSPALFTTKRRRLPAILTHELSHAHIRSWMSELSFIALPNWFKEGLAVMVSDGGAAEEVSVADARDAIRWGDQIAVTRQGSLFDWVGVRMERPPQVPDTSFRIQMAYRQAGMFVAFLRDTNPAGFATMMQAILDGRPFADAVEAGYQTDVEALWLRFVRLSGQSTGATR
jgi:hypothetical protein